MKKFMISSLKYLGLIVVGTIIPYLFWLMFMFITPWLMDMSWGKFIMFSLFGLGIISAFVSVFAMLASFILIHLDTHWSAKVIPFLWALFYGYISFILPWRLTLDYNFLEVVIAISIDIEVLAIFITYIYGLFIKKEDI